MSTSPQPRTRKLTIVAQDPSVRVNNRIVRAQVDVPAEEIAPGPWGYRVHVVDYDASTDTLYRPIEYPADDGGAGGDPFTRASDRRLLEDPSFHAQNVYAIVMRTLARFEFALGRRVPWGFYGHQIKVAPHAFADANAFYSEGDEALLFGYFPGAGGRMIFSCLSHDVVAHETTHALLDGLRQRYTDPSSPEQAAFHEGFADVVALLSVFSIPGLVRTVIDLNSPSRRPNQIAREDLSPARLRKSILFGLADEMGRELSAVRGDALRRSADLLPSRSYIKSPEFLDPHRRGEILVAAVMNAFIEVWSASLESLGEVSRGYVDRQRVADEGAAIADYLLTMVIRAIDYTPPVNMEFCDFLSAVLTSDMEINPADSRYGFRERLRRSFVAYGVDPAAPGRDGEPGTWDRAPENLRYDRTHFESMQRDPDEVFRFVWENRGALGLYEDAFSRVLSVRPCVRIGPDGFHLHETVAEYFQVLDLEASELKGLRIAVPDGMPGDLAVRMYGGGALIFDEYGRLKYHVRNRLDDRERQTQRLKYLWAYGFFKRGSSPLRSFSAMHRQRAMFGVNRGSEEW